MRARFGGLWRHPDFRRLWAGQAVSQVGSQLTALALPLAAILALGATPAQLGLLFAAETAPFLLLGLPAGVWADRLRRRPLLIAADLGRALLLAALPLAAWLGALRLELLYAVGFLAGCLTVCFEVAYQAYLPSLVPRDTLVEANAKLQVSRSTAQVAGPGLAGLLVQLGGAPLALLLDAASFLASALSLARIRTPEPPPASRALGSPSTAERESNCDGCQGGLGGEGASSGEGLLREIAEGLRAVAGQPLLRAFAGKAAASNFAFQIVLTVLALYATRELGLGPGALGLVFAAGSVGNLLGAAATERLARRLGPGRTILGGAFLAGFGLLLVPLAGGPPALAAALLAAALVGDGFGSLVADVQMLSLQQAITPDRLQGRVNATTRFLCWGVIPLGAVLAGALGETIGLRATLAVGAAGYLLSGLVLLASPVRGLRQTPAAGDGRVGGVAPALQTA